MLAISNGLFLNDGHFLTIGQILNDGLFLFDGLFPCAGLFLYEGLFLQGIPEEEPEGYAPSCLQGCPRARLVEGIFLSLSIVDSLSGQKRKYIEMETRQVQSSYHRRQVWTAKISTDFQSASHEGVSHRTVHVG